MTNNVRSSGARHINVERLHKYTCNHSVEKDGCMFPPSHRASEVRINPHDSDVVLYKIKCNICEEKDVISDIVVNLLKEKIRVMLWGHLRMKEPGVLDPVDVKWTSGLKKRRKILVTFSYPKEGTEGEQGEIKAAIYPARKLDADRSHKWESIKVDMTFDAQFKSMELQVDIINRLDSFEKDWNEIKYPSTPYHSFLNFSSSGSEGGGDDLFDFEEPFSLE
ncbi:uncharacterized protein TRUGW13939_08372 [Talaromyces rugulosus]|uniref:Uncharacterized protein n=1 Tax=Talaromyces rugulosus TaxID=121627 RepID=A0A7H8R6L2_TALRU|nr:uncharacterized protein TRUGW13939_08372 [Talaromyces rugulosus]QKX61225.1 hypothetical protein TRUGW13939_08372 [Talaromyces rugulosus]